VACYRVTFTLLSSSKIEGDGGTGVHVRKGTTSKLMSAIRLYDEFYNFTASVLNIFHNPRNVIVSTEGIAISVSLLKSRETSENSREKQHRPKV
jgi:hypothetical protein